MHLSSIVILFAVPLLALADPVTIRLIDYAEAPITGTGATSQNAAYHARLNFMRHEPVPAGRLFVNDLNGPLYIFSTDTREFTLYLNFNGRGDNPGMFRKFTYAGGYANGLIAFAFDPDYANNGIFYTIHLEEPNVAGSAEPDNANTPGLDTSGYTTTSVVAPVAGPTDRHAVLIEWTDDNIANETFEGTAREILRTGYTTRIHTMGDIIFNPNATDSSHPEWRVLYIANGDGGSGESNATDNRSLNSQRLDSLEGKILRIIPDLSLHTDSSSVSENGRYRVPNDNPFADLDGARPEVWTAGHRNQHRLSWDPVTDTLIASEIGLHSWEELNIIHPGANYGYPLREGPEQLVISRDSDHQETFPLPSPDLIPIRINATETAGETAPLYPVVIYRTNIDGDSVSSGFVYRGSRLPELHGKFVFGDITTGELLYADYAEMLAADDGDPETRAERQTLFIQWENPYEDAGVGFQPYDSMFNIVKAAYQARYLEEFGEPSPLNDLPGFAQVTGSRADIRLVVDSDGELYVLSKSDGMIREFQPAPAPPEGLLSYEPFNYTPDTYSSASAPGEWGETLSNGSLTISEESLEHPNHFPSTANKATITGPAAMGHPLPDPFNSGTYYFSYLTANHTETFRTLNLAFFSGSSERFAIGTRGPRNSSDGPDYPAPDGNVILLPSNPQNEAGHSEVVVSANPIAYDENVLLVVGKIEFDINGGNEDRISLFLNPDPNQGEANAPYLVFDSNDVGELTHFRIFAGGASGALTAPTGSFDEIRFGTSYAAVALQSESQAKQDWLESHFLPEQLLDADISGDDADPEGDGIINLLEYAFDFDPLENSRGDLPSPEKDETGLRLIFEQMRDDLEYIVEASANLTDWAPEGVTLSTTGTTVTATYSAPDADRIFLRVRVTPKP